MSRLGDFWRGQARLGKVLTIVVIVVGALLIIGAITGRSNDDVTSTPTTTATDTEVAAADPISCLDLGLSNVEERSSRTWRGNNDAPFYLILGHLLPSKAEAQQAVADAVDVYAARAGSYAVTGPLKVGQLSAVEGRIAKSQVDAVAVCLGG